MFVTKKVISAFVLPPGLFVSLLVISGVFLFCRNRRAIGIWVVFMGSLVWSLSISPVSMFLLNGLESGYEMTENPEGDVIILLGGGMRIGVPDLSGTGFPSGDTLERMVTTVRLHKRLRIPIVISAGHRDPLKAGVPIIRRILVDLGANGDQIFVEDKSRDTRENAKFSKEVCSRLGFEEPILVTSAYHLGRSQMAFAKVGLETTPYPASFLSIDLDTTVLCRYLPHFSNLADSARALHEYLGMVFYRLVY